MIDTSRTMLKANWWVLYIFSLITINNTKQIVQQEKTLMIISVTSNNIQTRRHASNEQIFVFILLCYGDFSLCFVLSCNLEQSTLRII